MYFATESRTTVACCCVKLEMIFSPRVMSCFFTVHLANSAALMPRSWLAFASDGSVAANEDSVLDAVILILPMCKRAAKMRRIVRHEAHIDCNATFAARIVAHWWSWVHEHFLRSICKQNTAFTFHPRLPEKAGNVTMHSHAFNAILSCVFVFLALGAGAGHEKRTTTITRTVALGSELLMQS